MENNRRGYLVISLDFELIWGVFDKVNPYEKVEYFRNTKQIIPEILKLFSDFNIQATWATVGMLFNNNWDEWEENVPHVLPGYEKEELSPYKFGNVFKNQKESSFFSFAADLIEEIKKTPGQEIGIHTYSHYYCLEKGQTLNAFKADLEKSIELAKKFDINLKSLVFPRNQFNQEYLEICLDLGIENVRSNPAHWYWQNTHKDTLLSKVARTGDAYLGPKNKSYSISSLEKEEGKPLEQRASRLLRPYSNNKVLRKLKLERIESEMVLAAKKGEIYHLWWHPHNFGSNPQENLNDLKRLLMCYDYCNREYGFSSRNMDGINSLLLDLNRNKVSKA